MTAEEQAENSYQEFRKMAGDRKDLCIIAADMLSRIRQTDPVRADNLAMDPKQLYQMSLKKSLQ